MTHHEREALADRCARCDASGTPDAQALLAEARAQVEEARRERDAERARIDSLNKSREHWYALWDQATEQIDRLEHELTTEHACRMHADADLADARASAEQAVKVAESIAAEKSALVSRVAVLEAALRGLSSDLDRYICPKCRRELSALQTCPWCAKVAVALTEVDRVSELQARVTLLEDLLRRYHRQHNAMVRENVGGYDVGCFCSICADAMEALIVLKVKP